MVHRSSKRKEINKEVFYEDSDEDESDEEEEEEEEYETTVLTVIKKYYFPGKKMEEESEEQDSSQPEKLQDVIKTGVTIIISFIAGFITDLIMGEEEIAEITVMVMIICAIWFSMDPAVRQYINFLWIIQKNTVYKDVVIAIVNLVSYLGVYMIPKLGLTILNDLWKSSNINVGEAFVCLSTIFIALYGAFYTEGHLNR